ncbi:hypothetical protein B7494_g8032 [Chlorociboria aeruginascens]|nr:hypothetical protein B7494_g8032 [Chlorociboria aeruginascens]
MAHIAELLAGGTKGSLGLNNFIARELSPSPAPSLQDATPDSAQGEDKHIWRMYQPSEPRKFHLFPTKEKLSISAGRKSPDSEAVRAVAIAQTGSKEDRILGTTRSKSKEPSLIRRRKVSVPELGPMTTVQEIAMDSPTIPGRPPVHERSISAPNSWRQHAFADTMISCITGPALDERPETVPEVVDCEIPSRSFTKKPTSPKLLTPLVIPANPGASNPRLIRHTSVSQLMRPDSPPDVPPKSARMFESPAYQRNNPPFTPNTSTTTTNHIPSVSSTPKSAPEGRSSPKPWANPNSGANVLGHSRGQSDVSSRSGQALGHRRGESDASIMDRGRPKKRLDGSTIKGTTEAGSRREEEHILQKAFEALPQGIRATEAASKLTESDMAALKMQAFGQASRFDVLNSKDVEALSRELRALDERCEYLRKTHRSLRSGRRNLHERICTYLRSPRVARFSHESILKQEEALAELDNSIDGWVSKLEAADNRRTRIRQKLLEHVAAALIMQVPSSTHFEKGGENTPPRSPVKAQSPQRLASPVPAQDLEGEEREDGVLETRSARREVESIKVYADLDVYALLADVEEEINRMGDGERRELTTPTQDMVDKRVFPDRMLQHSPVFSPLHAVSFEGASTRK